MCIKNVWEFGNGWLKMNKKVKTEKDVKDVLNWSKDSAIYIFNLYILFSLYLKLLYITNIYNLRNLIKKMKKWEGEKFNQVPNYFCNSQSILKESRIPN